MMDRTIIDVLYTIQSIISSAPPALTAPIFPIFPPRTILTILSSFSSLTTSPVIAPLSALRPLFLSSLPRFLGEEVTLDVQRSMIAGVLSLLGSGVLSECHFKNSKESFLSNSDKALLSGLININNFLFSHMNDLVQSLHLPPHHLTHPKRLIHQLLGSLDSDERFSLSEKEREGTGDIASCMKRSVP